MAKDKIPQTQAIRMLKSNGVDFMAREYAYEEKGGTASAAKQFGVDEHLVIKTLVMEDEKKEPLIILMHGDREVSTKALARAIGAKTVAPCDPNTANKHTGYFVGGISPFGTKKRLRVFVEASILELDKVYINAGKRGMLVEMTPSDLAAILKPVPVQAAI